MKLSAAMIECLVKVSAGAAAAPHGGKEAVYQAACLQLGIARNTLLKRLKAVSVRNPRKRRADAGETSLTMAESTRIAAYLMETLRKNNKRLASIPQAVKVLRANGEIRAERIDPESGEIKPLSSSAIARAMRGYGMHPDQLLAPAPAVELISLHPNHAWQIDASLCVLYYLESNRPTEQGLQVMEAKKFYKNKPANLKRIENDRVWSYEQTDHNSGAIKVHYVTGAESATNISESFIKFIQKQDNQPMHGVPYILMMDMGSANTSGLFKNLLRRLDVEALPHAPENARATGQVEKARDIIERSFESTLRFQPVHSIDELNALGEQWSAWYNADAVHSRHGRTRSEQWMTIKDEHLRIAPSPELCRELLTHAPERRKVNDFLRVSFAGREFDVSKVPNVMVGEWLDVTYNPYVQDAAYIVDYDQDGNEILHAVPVVARNDDGFAVSGNVIGEDYSRPVRTLADANREAVELVAMDAETLEEAKAKRKAKALPFGGRIDPHKPMKDATLPTYMPRRGHAHEITTTVGQAPERILSRFEAAAELSRLGIAMDAEKNRQVAAWYPDGVPESAIVDLQHRLTVKAGLRVVGA